MVGESWPFARQRGVRERLQLKTIVRASRNLERYRKRVRRLGWCLSAHDIVCLKGDRGSLCRLGIRGLGDQPNGIRGHWESIRKFGGKLLDLALDVGLFCDSVFIRDGKFRFIGIVEQGEHPVVFMMRNRIVFVRMALRAPHG